MSIVKIIGLTVYVLSVGCGRSEKVDKGVEKKPEVKAPPSGSNVGTEIRPAEQSSGGFQLPATPLLRAQYDITVDALGMTVCHGKADLNVTNKFTFEIPQAKVNCFASLCQFDLSKALAGMSQSNGGQGILAGAKVENGVVSVPSVSGATFTPPRLTFLVPFSMTPEELAKINLSQQTSVAGPNGEQDSGTISLSVLGVNESITGNDGVTYNKVVRWQISSQGFNSVKPKFLLFDSLKMAWNLDPIAVPELVIAGQMNQMSVLSGGGGCGLGGGGILGGIGFVATLKLATQTSIDPNKP